VTVTVAGQTATLPRGFTYAAPGPNLPPVISAITIQSTQANAPSGFADLSEEVPVSATVTDAETPVGQLTYEWSATLGTFTGTGASVRWRAPASAATPATVTLTLKVTEAVSGAPGTQSSSKSATLSLHNSLKEISDMSYQFLVEFSQQSPTPEQIANSHQSHCILYYNHFTTRRRSGPRQRQIALRPEHAVESGRSDDERQVERLAEQLGGHVGYARAGQRARQPRDALEDVAIAPQRHFVFGATLEVFKGETRDPPHRNPPQLLDRAGAAEIAASVVAPRHSALLSPR